MDISLAFKDISMILIELSVGQFVLLGVYMLKVLEKM